MRKVRIIEDEGIDTGKVDDNGRPIVHEVFIVDSSNGETLAKYQAKEHTFAEEKDPKTGKVDRVQKTISGKEAAKRAAEINHWQIVRY